MDLFQSFLSGRRVGRYPKVKLFEVLFDAGLPLFWAQDTSFISPWSTTFGNLNYVVFSLFSASQINFPFSWKNHKNNFPRRSLRIHEGKIAYSKNKTSFSVRIILETWFVVIGLLLLLLCCKLLICCYAGKNTPTHNFFLKSINETYWACWRLRPWNSVNV